MSKRISEKDLIEILKSVKDSNGYSPIYIGGYISTHTKCIFGCPLCDTQFSRTPNDVTNNNRALCRSCSNKFRSEKQKKSIKHVKQRIKEVGFDVSLIKDEEYKNNKSKLSLICSCGRKFLRSFHEVDRGAISCGHCNDPKVGDRFFKVIITEVMPSRHGGCSIKGKCDCGNLIKLVWSSQLPKSCGHCNDLHINDKFGRLTVIEVKKQKFGCRVKCKCDCGTITQWLLAKTIRNSNTKSCGHCNDPKIGDIFFENEIIKVIPSKSSGCSVKVKCKCGKIFGPIKFNIIKRGNTKSCGNCQLKRNGCITSQIVIDLEPIVSEICGHKFEHNVKTKYSKSPIDLVCEELKIAIEYNSYYYHMVYNGDRSKKDKDKYKRIVDDGYKLLVINSSGNDIPSRKQLEKIFLNDFQHGITKKTITMKSWYKAIYAYSDREKRRESSSGNLGWYWTKEQDDYLLSHYMNVDIKILSKKLNKTKSAINHRWQKIKPTGTKNKRSWTKKEDDYLLSHYMNMNIKILSKKLNKSKSSILSRWNKIKPKDYINKHLVSEQDFIERLKQIERFGYHPIYSDEYITMKRKCLFKCPHCHKQFCRTPQAVILQHQVLCRSCSYKLKNKSK